MKMFHIKAVIKATVRHSAVANRKCVSAKNINIIYSTSFMHQFC